MIERFIPNWTGKERRKEEEKKPTNKHEDRTRKIDNKKIFLHSRATDFIPGSRSVSGNPVFAWQTQGIDILRTRYGEFRPIYDKLKEEDELVEEIEQKTKKKIVGYTISFSDRCREEIGFIAKDFFGRAISLANEQQSSAQRFKFKNYAGKDCLEGTAAMDVYLNPLLTDNCTLLSMKKLTKLTQIFEQDFPKKIEELKEITPTFLESIAISMAIRNSATGNNYTADNYSMLRLPKTVYGRVPAVPLHGEEKIIPGIINLSSGDAYEGIGMQNSAFLMKVKRYTLEDAIEKNIACNF